MLKLDSARLSYLPLAGSNVLKLVCAPKNENDWLDMAAVARRTNLTELSLTNIRDLTDCHKLRSLALQTLILVKCPGAEVTLFVPGALTALETLGIHEEESELLAFNERLRESSAPESQEQQIFQQISQAGKVLLSLPRLREVRGSNKLFLLGIINEQIGWKRTCHYGSHRSHVYSCLSCRCATQVWERV